ncbi:MAG: hypothetical protein UY70_C0008G0024 [Candidatus Kaiserbacteria bacterium GW2011_GWB1_52_6]|uniref:Fimbrial assembly family protein n=2 Tax=Candidatus Kaiseribacteriota TaxID=1752734 RepID=A0A0G1XA96_9BACT|nr:MAG: hypothetical protein UY67_C0031G0024 [Candidatus Kaiserbacteria bacterium GW2011_GWA2_52_12]KKW27745.1 MAG: hypothetical protein UY70_C0008G0024 [Candidatus Kaiserbacteria bacterium GW2011_GWB1_52_6]
MTAPAGVARLRTSTTGLYDLFLLIAVVLFIASAVLGIGVFLYQQFLQTQAASKLDSLQRAKAAFEPALIQKLTRLDDRMRSADELLAAHLAPTVFFKMLEQTTLQTAAFNNLTFEAANPSDMSAKLTGVAQSVNSIALQADLFGKNSIFVDPIFGAIARQPDGVHFDVSVKINPALVKYDQLIASQQAAAATAAGVNAPALQTAAPASPFDAQPPTN